MAPSPKRTPRSKQPKTVSFKDSQKPSEPVPGNENVPKGSRLSTNKQVTQTPAAAQRKGTNTSEASSAATDNTTSAIVSSGTRSGSAKRPSTSTGQSTINTTPSAAVTGLEFLNQPKTQSHSQWKKGYKPFSTLHYRAVADKRSRAEGTPDIEALEIVNDPSATTKKKARIPGDDIYSRREFVRCPEADASDHDNAPGQDTIDLNIPLSPWETDKVPMVCNAWRVSSKCPKSARDCLFMHRNKDPDGRDYPVHEGNDTIPPKYRRQPLTCVWWLRGPDGCSKSADECIYAHRNTGNLQNHISAHDPPTRIDSSALPLVRTTNHIAPSNLTCWYWANAVCRKSAQDCSYQHYHTGTVANGPPGKIAIECVSENSIHAQGDSIQGNHDGPLEVNSIEMDTDSTSGNLDEAITDAHDVPVDRIQTIQRSQHLVDEQPPQPQFSLLPPPPPPPPVSYTHL